MKTYIIDNGSSHITELARLLAPYEPIVLPHDDAGIAHIPQQAFVVLSGGHADPVLWHAEQYRLESDLIRSHAGPIIGVCLGFELIAHVFGAHLHQLAKRRGGLYAIRLADEQQLMPAGPRMYDVYESHNWAVKELPPILTVVAESESGVAIFKHINRPIYGVQFHPESTEGPEGAELFALILKDLKIQP